MRELKDVRRHCQYKKPGGGWSGWGGRGWGGVLGPCQGQPCSFWLPWINLLAGELWGEGRSGGISSVALLWLSAELSARTHTQNPARHTINTHIHIHIHIPQAHSQSRVWETRDASRHTCQSLVKYTLLTRWETEKERADKNRKKGIKHLSTFPTFHFLLVVGGVALCWSLVCREMNTQILKLKKRKKRKQG